ncbi:hypothetical protein DVH24_029422 [Malus domestica]|uniref:serine O-acetyltransferase n=1 Tax=Malus domestica TaxID=3750 RepID=A0A498HZX4_MALDO|nr:hypothetical protein DVH24_029422 [Malus domestica]
MVAGKSTVAVSRLDSAVARYIVSFGFRPCPHGFVSRNENFPDCSHPNSLNFGVLMESKAMNSQKVSCYIEVRRVVLGRRGRGLGVDLDQSRGAPRRRIGAGSGQLPLLDDTLALVTGEIVFVSPGKQALLPHPFSTLLYDLFFNTFSSDPSLRVAAVADLYAAHERDPACISFSYCLLNYKGFLACHAHRVAHKLWIQNRRPLALVLHSRIVDVFAVDIHPTARIEKGVLFDHATWVVVGETAVIGNNVSILHHVTLGGTGKAGGYRHPKIRDGVLIGASATNLGNVKIGEGVKIRARSVVLIDVPVRMTAVGNPARLVGGKERSSKHEDVPGQSMYHTSFISEWSDYII